MKTPIIFLIILLNCVSILAQEDSIRINDYFNKQLNEFSETNAKQDLRNGKVNLVMLISNSNTTNPQLSNEQVNSIEKRFGFKYYYYSFDIPQDFLKHKQQAYNNVVYAYLDSINKQDTREEIMVETARLTIENNLIANRTDKQLKKIVWKEFRKQDKGLRETVLLAEKNYRDRAFEKALIIYNQVEQKLTTEKAKKFIYNAKYHSLMNMEKFDEAIRLRKLDENSWINRRMK